MAASEVEQRLAALEEHVRRLEDEREIAGLIAAYGPLVDGGRADEASALWEQEGVYDVDELLMQGRDQIAGMVRSSHHQSWIRGGCAHVVGPPHVRVDGDAAVAVCHSLMVVHQDDRFVVRRATANHWELRRTAAGWRVSRRTSRVLDGREESPALLGRVAEGLTA